MGAVVLALAVAVPISVVPMPSWPGLDLLSGVAFADVETPEQRDGSASGLPHEASAESTAANASGAGASADVPDNALPHEWPTLPEDTPSLEPPVPEGTAETEPEIVEEPAAPEIAGFDEDTSVELVEERSEFSRTFENADGTLATQFSTEPMHFDAGGGEWEEIDTSLVGDGDGGWTNAADSADISFAPDAAAEELARLEVDEGRVLSFGLEGATDAEGVVEDSAPDTITYHDALPGVDVELQTQVGGSVKETIVLSAPPADAGEASWRFPLGMEGIRPRLDERGAVELLDEESGEVLGHIPAGYMIDSDIDPRSGEGTSSEEVSYRLVREADGWVLVVTADHDWLTDDARVYPVRVDPTAAWNYNATSDTYVQTGYNTSRYSEQELKAGTYNGGSDRAASYLRFNSLVDRLEHARIYSAELYLFNHWSYSCQASPVRVHAVTQSWNQTQISNFPGPNYESQELGSRSFARGWIAPGSTTSSCPARYEGIDLGTRGRDLVQGWVDGTRANYGITVRASDSASSGWKRFGSRESWGAPYMTVVYSPYRAEYAFAQDPPVLDPAPTANRATYVDVRVTNRGAQTWTPTNNFRLSYQVYDTEGERVYHQAATTAMPRNVATGQSATVRARINPLPPGEWEVRFDMVHGVNEFSAWGVPRTAQLSFEVPDLPPQLIDYSPRSGARVASLTPDLTAVGRNNDNWPTDDMQFYFYLCDGVWPDWECTESGWQSSTSWRVPAGTLQWGRQYFWSVWVNDGGEPTGSPWLAMTPAPEQPAITSRLAGGTAGPQAALGRVDPSIGNYTQTVTDASVEAAGPPLSVTRSFNSQDPRGTGMFGAGWSTRFDMRVVPDGDGTGNVVVTYPDGRALRFAANGDGSYEPPLGEFATLAEVDGGWRLMDKAATSYLFDAEGRLESVTDHRGRSQTLTYGTDGRLETVTGLGGRALSFDWTGGHVGAVSVDPGTGGELTWTYGYDGDRLTEVCDPEGGCTSYGYSAGSHYRSAVMDANPAGYWRFEEPSGTVLANEVPTALGGEAAANAGAALGAAGALAGVTTSSMSSGPGAFARLPERALSRLGTHVSVEAWFRTTGSGVIVSYQNTATGAPTSNVPLVYVGTDGRLRGGMWTGLPASPITSDGAVNDGQWHHAVLSTSGTSQRLYLDGELVGTKSGQILFRDNAHTFVGQGWTSSGWPGTPATSGQFAFTGQIDDVALYQRPLGAQTVADHYTAGADAADRLTSVTTPEGRVQSRLVFDETTGRVADHTDHNGGTWHYTEHTYTGSVDDEEPHVRSTVTVTDPRGGTAVSAYEPLESHRLVRTVDQLGHPTTMSYDVGGFLATMTDPNGATTSFYNDERGNRLGERACRDAEGQVCFTQWYTYHLDSADPFDPTNDQLRSHLDGRSAHFLDGTYQTWWTYNEFGDQTAEVTPATADFPEGRVTRFTYTDGTEQAVGGGTVPAGLLETETDPRGGVTTHGYTAAGDTAWTREPSGLRTEYTHDGIGRVLTETVISDSDLDGATTEYAYDGAGRLVRTTSPAVTNEITGVTHTAQVVQTYDADGNRLTETLEDPTGGSAPRTTEWIYDAHGRVAQEIDALGAATAYGYDATGAVTSRTDADGNLWQTEYTLRGEVAEQRLHNWTGSPDEPVEPTPVVLESMSYDPAGRLATRTDAVGRTTAHTYYADGQPAQTIAQDAIVDDSGEPRDVVVESRTYDGAGNLTRLVTGNGATRIDYTYAADARLVSEVLDPEGLARETRYGHDGNGNVTSERRTDGGERTEETRYLYDAGGHLIEETVVNDGGEELTTTYTVDDRGLTTEVVDPRGNADGADPADYTVSMRYDAVGQLVEETGPAVTIDRYGEPRTTRRTTIQYGYDVAGNQSNTVDAEGRLTSTVHDALDRAVSSTQPSFTGADGQTITPTASQEFDALGRKVSQTDANGNVRRYTYDQLGNLVRITDPPRQVGAEPGEWLFSHNLAGEQIAAVDPEGGRIEATYDDLGRQASETQIERLPEAAAFTTRYAHDDAGNTTAVTDPLGNTRTTDYNAAGEMTSVTDALGNTAEFDYDLAGRLTRVTDPLGVQARTRYDLAGRAVETSDHAADGTRLRGETVDYDEAGNPVATTSALGHTTTRAFDPQNRLVQLVEPVADGEDITTTFGYDAFGDRTRVTDGRGNATYTTYHAAGLVASVIEPATTAHPDAADRTWTTYYDAAGNPVREVLPGGVARRRSYDGLNQPVAETGTGAEAATTDRAWEYDAAGRLASISSSAGDISITYNDRGDIAQILGPTTTPIGQPVATSTFTYDGAGRLVEREDLVGTAAFGYNAAGWITSRTDPLTGESQQIEHDAVGRVTLIESASGAVEERDYDDLGRRTGHTVRNAGGTVTAATVSEYDLEDRLTETTITGGAHAGTHTYGYDRAGRLTSWTAPDGTLTDYEWDAAGNRVRAGDETYSHDERNRVTASSGGDTWTYSARGTIDTQIVDGVVTTMRFDAFEQLISDGRVHYGYDALGRITTRTDNPNAVIDPEGGLTSTLTYAGLDNNPVAVVDPDGNLISQYGRDPDGELLSTQEGGTDPALAYTNTHTDLAATFTPHGELAATAAYTPFGEPVASTGTPQSLGYQGEWTDPANGNVNMHARWYQPHTGRFTSRDTLTLEPDPSVQANRYTYANAAPTTHTDPTGHFTCFTGFGCARRTARWIFRQFQPKPSPRRIYTPFRPKIRPPITWPNTHSKGRGSLYQSGGGGGGWALPVLVGIGAGIGAGLASGLGTAVSLAPIVIVDPRIAILNTILNTPQPRPPIRNRFDQRRVNEMRDQEENKIDPVAVPVDIVDLYEEYGYEDALDQVRNDLGHTPTDDTNDQQCEPFRDYGTIRPNGQRTGIVARFCDHRDLGGGADALRDPPGYQAIRVRRDWLYNRGHLLGQQFGGDGRDENIVTLYRHANAPTMSGYENRVADIVSRGNEVLYRVTPVYVGNNDVPAAIHLQAVGRSYSVDICITNSETSLALPGYACRLVPS
ncbi:DNRLRE domain-containing protein [Allonocardiopsis opalescens]|uniref:DNRLRE domain-containing protein n=1 Tax=Allonocardiopsis opalescens TaxID=1144618 RepID=UPI001FE2FD5E|nr:DNRLRE domain-containing protein [Allonocardiopsis opalescens]